MRKLEVNTEKRTDWVMKRGIYAQYLENLFELCKPLIGSLARINVSFILLLR
jgi:hypothetical protein